MKTSAKLLTLATLLATASTSVIAYASTVGATGAIEQVTYDETYSQYEGYIRIRESGGTLTSYFWGGARCSGAEAPPERAIQLLFEYQLHDRDVKLFYNDTASAYGTSRCWDGRTTFY